jgi:TPR repeat protein
MSNSEIYEPDDRFDPFIEEYRQLRSLISSEGTSAVPKMEALAYRGSVMAVVFIADQMRIGSFYDRDLPGAERWYRSAADSGSARALHGLGLTHWLMGGRSEAVEEFERAVAQT